MERSRGREDCAVAFSDRIALVQGG
jgi:hypothetical protein